MKWLINILKNPKVVLGFLVIILILLIIVAGIRYEWSWERQILLILILLFLWTIIFLYLRLQAIKNASVIEQSIKVQAEQNLLSMRPDKRAEIEQLKEQLTAAIEALKNSKLARGINGKSALYALPWYLFIGPSGVGKTTAIINSGLEFPYGLDKIRGIGGTRNCDWFFSNSAILLDTAGRYTTQEEDREEWYSFLDILRKNRKKKPINGVIIGISIADLFQASSEEVENHAKKIRERIDELLQKLGVVFPVYLVFLKCDLIQGFIEFYGDFSRGEREQIWGCTFPLDSKEDMDPASAFKLEYQRLYEALKTARLDRLNNPLKREERRKVYTFPLEFLEGKHNLTRFVEILFQKNAYQENPHFRGFYFTSGTQEGVPIDRVIQSIARQFDLPPETVERFDPTMETKSYFIKDLFTDVIIPDENMVEPTARISRVQDLMKLGVFSGIIIFMLLLFFGLTSNYFKFVNHSKNFSKFLKSTQTINWTNESFSNNFNLLENYRQYLFRFQDTPFLAGSVYRGKAIAEIGNLHYYKKLKPFVKQYIYTELLSKRLMDYLRNDQTIYREEAYNNLRIYLLLGNEFPRFVKSKDERNYLKSEISGLVDTLLERRFNFSYQQASQNVNLTSLKSVVKRQIAYFLDIIKDVNYNDLDQTYSPPFETNENLVNQVRRKLGTPNIYDVYSRIRREGMLKGQPLTLYQVIGGYHSEIFEGGFEMPWFFTKECYETFVKNEIKKAIEYPYQEDWVLGIKEGQLPHEIVDSDVMRNQLELLYYQEYVRNWWQFLRNITIRPFDTISLAKNRMRIMGDFIDSPIRKLLESVTEQTQLESKIATQVKDAGESIGIEASQHPVDREFQRIHRLSGDEGGNLSNILGQFDLISSIMENLESGSDIQTAEYTANIIETGSGELSVALRSMRNGLTGIDLNVQQNVFKSPVLYCWKILLDRTAKYLNQIWEDEVYNAYADIANYYPFNKQGVSEAPISNVLEFFEPQNGILWSFFRENLSPYINDNSWTSKTWEGKGIVILSESKEALDKANEITRGLGLQGGGSLQLIFNIQPDLPSPPGLVDQINLTIDGRVLQYRMGKPNEQQYNWPGSEGAPGARLEINTTQGFYVPKEFQGRWGLFRLLELADIQRISASNFNVSWYFTSANVPKITIKFKLRTESTYNPFGKSNFFHLKLPMRLF